MKQSVEPAGPVNFNRQPLVNIQVSNQTGEFDTRHQLFSENGVNFIRRISGYAVATIQATHTTQSQLYLKVQAGILRCVANGQISFWLEIVKFLDGDQVQIGET